MILIDKPMPEGCDVCPLMYDYIQCNALPEGCKDDDAFNEEEFDWTKRPEWCPLKEQEAEWIEYPECLAYDGAYSDSHIVCSACKHVFSIMDNCTEEFDYCPHCGAKMKQEGR